MFKNHKYNWRVSARWLPLSYLVLSGVVLLLQDKWVTPQANAVFPKTRIDNVTEQIHGVQITDPYRWLEDQNSTETRAWIDLQTAYTQSILASLPGREKLERQIKDLIKEEILGVPTVRNGHYFFSKRFPDLEQRVICMRKGFKGKDEVLIDPNLMSPARTTSVGLMGVSKDGKLLAYSVRQGGEDEITVAFLDVQARKNLTDQLPRGLYGGIHFKPDKSGFYYSVVKSEGPRLCFHGFGKPTTSDREIFGKGIGLDKRIAPALSENGRYLLITVFHGSSRTKTEIYFQDLNTKAAIRPIVNDIDAGFSARFAGDQLFIETNWEAPNGRIFQVDLKHPERARWREVIPTGDSVVTGFSVAGGRIFVNYLKDVQSRVKIFDPLGKSLGEISPPYLGTISGVSGRWESDEAFYSFTSFHIPPTIYRFNVGTKERDIWSSERYPLDAGKFEVKQIWYTSTDGTRVPMFVVHAKGLKLDGSNPAYLTGYGGFNLNSLPSFSPTAALWVELGGVYAVPNLRGGGELGEAWHRAGMLGKKQNVFDDFIAAAEWLVKQGYTNPSKLVISGTSNGGLLVGNALTERPDLFRAVICGFPLLDMVRYHKFLVAKTWVSEYGSSDDPSQFKFLFAYSPYHHVKAGVKYPAVLFVSGDSDTRVDPLHARKMAALLQASTASDKPILLKYDRLSGHTQANPLSKQIKDLVDRFSFLLWQLGVNPT